MEDDMRSSMTWVMLAVGMSLLFVTQTGFAQSSYIEHIVDDESNYPLSVCTADLDGDGDQDIVFAADHDEKVAWWENVDGLGTTMVEHIIDGNYLGAYSVQVADVDNDGDIDVLGAAREADRISWWENLDGSGLLWAEHTIDPYTWSPAEILVNDIDGDGDDDVVGISYIDSYVVWWENDISNTPTWEKHTVDDSFEALGVDAADLDGDGDLDILGSAMYADEIAWWENIQGDGESWDKHDISADADGAHGLSAADIDGDGDMDFVVALSNDNDVVWFENLAGSGLTWSQHLVPSSLSSPDAVTAVDFDFDGDMDIVGVGRNGPFSLYLWTNFDGLGSLWVDNQVGENFYGGNFVTTADMDGDLDLDIIGSANVLNRISWWEQNQPLAQFQVELIPLQDVIPPMGGQYLFRVAIINETGTWRCGDIWTETYSNHGVLISPLDLRTLAIPEGSIMSEIVSQRVPGYVSAGYHRVYIYFGNFDQRLIVASDWDSFTKSYSIASGFDSWESTPIVFNFDEPDQVSFAVPTEFRLELAYPNPFNSSTTILVNLPESAELSVLVYNVMGQAVVTLMDGQLDAGSHNFTFDASDLASGLYFVRARVSDQLDEVQKVMLVR
jgi:FG-GAP-like repeat/Secretion system C-terminal sorting domain